MTEALKLDGHPLPRGHLLGSDSRHLGMGGSVAVSSAVHRMDPKKRETALQATARRALKKIIEGWAWDLADVWHESPLILDDVARMDPWAMLSHFPLGAVVWTGEVGDSGQPRHSRNFCPVGQWWQIARNGQKFGSFTATGIFKAGSMSRSKDNLVGNPFTVLDFDTLPDGTKPSTEDGQAELHAIALAVIRWTRERLRGQLVAVLKTGGKGIQAWFKTDGLDVAGLKEVAPALGLDKGLIGRGEQPVRLAGAIHQKTGRQAILLWCGVSTHSHTIKTLPRAR